MKAARYLVTTPNGRTIQIGIGERDMVAVPIPRPEGEEEFALAINRRFSSSQDLEAAITAAGGDWRRLL